ncbi:hypothetical protein [Aquimarina celericrescens]|uniref:Uncharacterized protein n=1 Tax=Aquimarina celericrescens TaxID=1964542 RepID=A0ABW5AV92_9FLAO|nr:hypothetical protein [Aquimarina celericrescens]
MTNTFKILPTSEMKIIKKIELITSNSNDMDIVAGFIIYKRELSSKYSFTEQTKNRNSLHRPLKYLKHDEYPKDNIDQLILETIQKEFPKARLRNNLLFSTSDVEYYDKLIKRPYEEAELIIEPDFLGMEIQEPESKIITRFWRNVNIYVNHSKESIKNITFKGNCDFTNREHICDQLEYKIEFL